eukprot:523771-Amorphochlora_amoeboformis.AAC.1
MNEVLSYHTRNARLSVRKAHMFIIPYTRLLSPTIEKVGFAFNLENHESTPPVNRKPVPCHFLISTEISGKMSLEELNMHSCTVGLTEEETKTMISDLCTEGVEVTLADLIASYDDGNKLLQK